MHPPPRPQLNAARQCTTIATLASSHKIIAQKNVKIPTWHPHGSCFCQRSGEGHAVVSLHTLVFVYDESFDITYSIYHFTVCYNKAVFMPQYSKLTEAQYFSFE